MTAVSVDDDFARFGAKSYAINKITSVEVRERKPHAAGCAFGLAAGAALALVLTIAGLIPFVIVAAGLGGLAWWQWKRSKIVEYQLFLITSASETQAFVTRDEGEVLDLRQRIETAMARAARGG